MPIGSLGFSKSKAESASVDVRNDIGFNSSGWTVSTGKSSANGLPQWVVYAGLALVAALVIKKLRK